MAEIKRLPNGTKDQQRQGDHEDRTIGYRRWRRTISNAPYTNDVDQVEWIVHQGRVIPVAALELTRVDSCTDHPSYYAAILRRFREQGQGAFAEEAARKLGCDAYIVAYHSTLKIFWLYNLSQGRGWLRLTQQDYKDWIQFLKRYRETEGAKWA